MDLQKARRWRWRLKRNLHEYLTHPIWRWKYRKLLSPKNEFYKWLAEDIRVQLAKEEDRQILHGEGMEAEES